MQVDIVLDDFQPEVLKMLEAVGASSSVQVFPHLMAALNKSALMMQELWRRFATGLPVPGADRTINSRGNYERSIQADLHNPIEKIVFTDYPAHKWIEEGSREYDMKPGLLRGPSSRATKSGGRINVISFRHGVPGTDVSNRPMPLNIYNLILQETKRAEARQVANFIGWDDSRQDALNRRQGMGGTPETKFSEKFGKYTWKSGKHEGMQRIDTSTGRAKSSKYITFRTVSTNSDPASWISPERAPIPIREAVVEQTKPIIEAMLAEAFRADIG